MERGRSFREQQNNSNTDQKGEEETLQRRIWVESKKIWRVAFPAMVVRVATFGALVVTQSFIGRGGETQLAAYALVSALFGRLAYGIMLGMGSATQTLCGQAFGAKKYNTMGIYLQRSWVVLTVTATILLPLFICASQFLRLIRQDNEVAKAAGPIALWFIPVIYSYVFYITTQMFLQSQLKNAIVAWLTVPTFLLHLLLSWLTVFKFRWGTTGAMASMVASNWLPCFGELGYIFGGWCKETWKGFSVKDAFTDLWPMVKLSIASGVMLCLQVWYVSVLVVLAGYMKDGKTLLSAFSICLNVSTWALMLSLGFHVSTSVRVSNELGGGNAKGAKFAFFVSLLNSTIVSMLFFVAFLIFGKRIGNLFTTDQDVRDAVSELSVLLAVSVLPNCFQPVLVGTAIGAGNQTIVAWVNIICYYVIGMPVGICLGYLTPMAVKGIWTGMIIGTVAQVICVMIITLRIDWDAQVNKTKARLSKWVVPVDNDNEVTTNDKKLENSNVTINSEEISKDDNSNSFGLHNSISMRDNRRSMLRTRSRKIYAVNGAETRGTEGN